MLMHSIMRRRWPYDLAYFDGFSLLLCPLDGIKSGQKSGHRVISGPSFLNICLQFVHKLWALAKNYEQIVNKLGE